MERRHSALVLTASRMMRAGRPAAGLVPLVAVAALAAASGCGGEKGGPGDSAPVPPFEGPPSNGTTPDTSGGAGEGVTPPSDGVDSSSEGSQMPVGVVDGEQPPMTGGEPSTEPGAMPVPGGYPEHTGAGCEVTAGALQPNDNLPDPFVMNDGRRITTMAEWTCRRAEIKKDLEEYEIGPKPAPPAVDASLAGNALTVTVTTEAGSMTLSSNVSPPGGAGPHCVAIGMNTNSSLISGCVHVPFMHNQVVAYAQNSNQSQNDPFYRVYPELFGRIGNYTAWSWGISRLIDGLEQVKDELNIDTSKLAVHGCSYAGKMALFGGALDERVALTVAQESGGGGINAWRTSQSFTTRTGTNIEKIDNTNYAWFKASMRNVDEYSLPHDHHELIAMIAPRAVVALGNPPYEWLGDESGFKSMKAAQAVYAAMGIEDRIGFDFASGHEHCAATPGQASTVNAFANRFLKGQDVDTNIKLDPVQANFDLDYASVIDWETPTLE